MKLDLKELISKITNTPIIIEQGTNGDWKYRKLSDGTVEAWYIHAFGGTTGAVWVNPIRYVDKTITVPTGIFTGVPSFALASTEGNQWTAVGVTISSNTSIAARFTTLATGSQALTATIYLRS